ncbi:MAG: hypothetical protein L0211_00570 [Planctomycetaceae bacterium]|nr:hypothetical protein [Planctomycetaceae bacterium]
MIAARCAGIRRLVGLLVWLLAAPAHGQIFEEFLGPPPAVQSLITDDQVAPAALFQPPALSQPAGPGAAPTRTTARRSRQQLASVPNMFGDFGMTTAQALFIDAGGNLVVRGVFDVPGAGGSRPVKIAENDSPIPVDRVFFNYNHFHNVFEFQEQTLFPIPQQTVRQLPIDRYTVGFEKTFLGGDWSVEMRLPLNGTVDAEGNLFSVGSGNWGNLAVIVKNLLYADEMLAVGAGLGIDIPTGSGAQANIGGAQVRFENDAAHLLPYVGAIWSPTESLFFTSFLQVDVATGGNEVLLASPGLPTQSAGKFNNQNLLYVDAGAGYWLYQNPYAECITGIAGVLEFHYTTALQDTDAIFFERSTTFGLISNPRNRFDVVNLTAGLNFLLGEMSNLRVAGAFPLGDTADQRFFDAEVQVQFNQRF